MTTSKEDLAFKVITAITAGFFWLTIMRFLSSYDEHVSIIERTVTELNQLENVTMQWRSRYDERLEDAENRIAILEGQLGVKPRVREAKRVRHENEA